MELFMKINVSINNKIKIINKKNNKILKIKNINCFENN